MPIRGETKQNNNNNKKKKTLTSSDQEEVRSEVAQSCLTLYDPMDCSLQCSSVHGISRQEYWSGLPFPSPGDLHHPGIEPRSLALQANGLLSEPTNHILHEAYRKH